MAVAAGVEGAPPAHIHPLLHCPTIKTNTCLYSMFPFPEAADCTACLLCYVVRRSVSNAVFLLLLQFTAVEPSHFHTNSCLLHNCPECWPLVLCKDIPNLQSGADCKWLHLARQPQPSCDATQSSASSPISHSTSSSDLDSSNSSTGPSGGLSSLRISSSVLGNQFFHSLLFFDFSHFSQCLLPCLYFHTVTHSHSWAGHNGSPTKRSLP